MSSRKSKSARASPYPLFPASKSSEAAMQEPGSANAHPSSNGTSSVLQQMLRNQEEMAKKQEEIAKYQEVMAKEKLWQRQKVVRKQDVMEMHMQDIAGNCFGYEFL